ncbi:cation diffusion facilitator family transporter [Leptolyngbya iicbica]|uniref:Cation transporter n=1 Tax=Leptolyngbya iicbica LK TaxID=2294035 RepID=A0A4Q7EA48_9CYAN|nr:cation diffusion facilitator family transporter [Leptolyngbya sp. LK]RZM77875.1 cation transporter [Leptolyngbya sp. LK]
MVNPLPIHCSACWQPTLKLRWLAIVMVTVTLFAGIELWVGWLSHSLTLRADSGHMLTDGLAMAIALAAAWMAQRSRSVATGNQRVEVLAALINSLALLAMAVWIGREAWTHWHGTPTEILTWPMLITSLLGLLINGLNLYWLHGDWRQDLNVRGVFLHILADLVGSVGAILAAIAVTFLNWVWADMLIGTAVALIIAVSAVPLLWQSITKLRTAPPDAAKLAASLEAVGWLETGQTDLAKLVTK